MNGPMGGANVINDQNNYDLIYRDLVFNSIHGINGSFKLDNINKIYKAELLSATLIWGSIPASVKNQTVLLSIPQLNGTTCIIPGNNGSVQSSIFCQIPDNNSSITTISFFSMSNLQSIQYYNPPINKLNTVDVSFFDTGANQVNPDTYCFTIRVYYFQKRNNTTTFSTQVNRDLFDFNF
jgi:hypothetical protein